MRTTLRYAAPRPPQTDGWRAERFALRAQIGEFLRRKQAAAGERLQAAAAEELPADVQPLLSGAAAPARTTTRRVRPLCLVWVNSI